MLFVSYMPFRCNNVLKAALLAGPWLLFLAVPCFGDDPLLVIDNGGHTARITRLAFSNDGGRLISAGEDKVIRIWDTRTGRVEQTIRGEIAPGQQGKIIALAVSPDGRMMATGGWMPGDTGAIRLHSLPSGEISAVLLGSVNVTLCLAFSADNRFLASGSADGGVRIWDVGSGRIVSNIGGKIQVNSITYSKDGKWLAWGGADGVTHLWNVQQKRVARDLPGSAVPVVSVKFSPDSRYLAAVDDNALVRVWDAGTSSPVTSFPGAESPATYPSNLSFLPDGSGLLVTSLRNQGPVAKVLAFPSGAPLVSFDRHSAPITANAISPDGRTAATSGGDSNEIYLWDVATGAMLRKLSGAGSAVWSAVFSRDGRAVAFGTERSAQSVPNNRGPLKYQIRLKTDKDFYHVGLNMGLTQFDAFPAIVRMPGLELSTDRGGAVLRILKPGGKVTEIALDRTTGFRHLSYTLTPDGRYVVSGALGGVAAVYSADNGRKVMDLIGHTGNVWAVSVSPDGRNLVSGSDDQTVRVWDLASGRSLLCFFLGDNQEWVAWTPQGYYASSLNGDKYVGWQVNGGNKELAKYYSVSRFQKTFYRPDVLEENLKTADITTALRAANSHKGGSASLQEVAKPADVAAAKPPEIYVAFPANNTVVHDTTVSVKGTVISTGSLPISIVRVSLDGHPFREYNPGLMRQDIDDKIPLTKGKHVLTVDAGNGKATSDTVVLQLTSDMGEAPPAGDLYFLSIGISTYSDSALQLHYADKDAEELERLVRQQANGKFFREVQTRLLPNERAKRKEILAALRWLGTSGTQNDTRILFLAGHGGLELGDSRSYFFCSYDCKSIDSADDGVTWSQLLTPLRAGAGRSVLMVDTCHAAAVSGARGVRSLVPDFTEVIKNTRDEMTGITYFTASKGTESSIEDPAWQHGAFTKALIEGIGGKAAKDDVITSDELGRWVTRRVAELTGEKQHAENFSEPKDTLPFPLFAVVR